MTSLSTPIRLADLSFDQAGIPYTPDQRLSIIERVSNLAQGLA